jgi:CHASE1-domain containing sensor protein
MFEKVKNFIKEHQSDIILLLGVMLISLLSFAMGYILAKQQQKEQIRFEKSANCESLANLRIRILVINSLFVDLL